MRILIADDSTARSKSLRAHFAPPSRRASARKSAGKAAMAEGQLLVSCAPARAGRGRKADECACSGLDLGDQPEQATAILDALGIALLNRGCREEGARLVKLALDIRRRVFGKDHPLTAASLNSYSRVQREQGEYEEAADSANDALRINRAVFGEQGLPVAASLYEVGVIQLQQGDYAKAERTAQDGLDIIKARGVWNTDPNTTRLLDVRGRAELGLGNAPTADRTYDELLKLDLAQLGTKEHPKYATHLANRGLVHEALKQRGPAEKAYRNAIDLYQRNLNRPCHPNLIDAYANLGGLLRTPPTSATKVKEAGKYLDQALQLGLKVRGKSHALVGNDYAGYGRWQYDAKQAQAAVKSFTAALQVYASSVKNDGLPADHFYIAEALTWKGRILVEMDSKAGAKEAVPLLQDAIAKWPAQRGPDSPGEGIAKACLGRALYLLDNTNPTACPLLCDGYRIVSGSVGDKDLVRRIAGWIKQQGCDCSQATPSVPLPYPMPV